ncbi:Calcineurin-like phosphoesterase domain, apaH type [Trema orientale]|uniref:Calcineurin-like phosphoesterase domain, apaH type n=1 Tax=Trema orientale TaxID=63057 RepID=A0A2P5BXU2_TREOI|nr:Calcineurin-like phosphoesterase domain, apaH type [Trema orientale]
MVVGFIPSCLTLSSQQPCLSNYVSKHILPIPSTEYKRGVRTVCITRPPVAPSSRQDAVGLRVFVLSDLHTDYAENMKWVKSLSTVEYRRDVLLVAGDVAETYNNFILTMSILKDRFEYVFFVPGNHDLWCRREGQDYLNSLEKLNKLIDACRTLGVEINPKVIEDLGIVPLFSWYHESFDKEKDIPNIRVPSLEMACKDFYACKWPRELSSGDASLALYFDAMNERNQNVIKEIQTTCSQIITFSHFVPRDVIVVVEAAIMYYRWWWNYFDVIVTRYRAMNWGQELCPEKRMLFYPKLPKIIGSDCLERRIRSIHGAEGGGSACHVFGHTHFCWDAVVNGIRYVQAPLAYPRERKRRMNGGENWLPFCIYSQGKFSDKISPCYWSDYYSLNPRTPHNTELAPWVSRFYNKT